MEKVRKKLGCAMPGVVGGTYRVFPPKVFRSKAEGNVAAVGVSESEEVKKAIGRQHKGDYASNHDTH
jgi:hypothetical protein